MRNDLNPHDLREVSREENDPFHRKYIELEQLGEGGAAVVKKCRNKNSSVEYACKIMRNYDSEKELNSKQEFLLM